MNLFERWKELTEIERSEVEHQAFWKDYFAKERGCYEYILENYTTILTGTLKGLADKLKLEPHVFVGFLEGINTSLINEVKLEGLEEENLINLKIDFEKLYFNMLDAKAEWLYNLPQWDAILTVEKRKEITKTFNESRQAISNKIGRNEICLCGSGKKYKKCCGRKS